MPTKSDKAAALAADAEETLATGDATGAVALFEAAIRIDPAFGEAIRGLAIAYADLNRWEESIAANLQAASLIEDDEVVAYNLAIGYSELRQFEEAEKWMAKVVERRPDDLDAAIRLGIAFAEQSKCEKALAIFNSIREREPANSLAHALAARELYHFGRADEAVAALEQVHVLSPEMWSGWLELREMYELLKPT